MARVSIARERSVVKLKSLARIGNQFLKPVVWEVTTDTALAENAAQTQQGNIAHALQVDRSRRELTPAQARALRPGSGVRFVNFKRYVRFHYGALENLAFAVEYAWTQLTALLPRKTGDAWRSIYFYAQNPENRGQSRVIHTIGGVRSWLSRQSSRSVSIHIIGPTVEYRRPVIYRKRGGNPLRRRARRARDVENRPGGTSVGQRTDTKTGRTSITIAKSINMLVAERTKRSFRDMYVKYRFIRSREKLPLANSPKWRPTGENINVPRIYIGLKRFQK